MNKRNCLITLDYCQLMSESLTIFCLLQVSALNEVAVLAYTETPLQVIVGTLSLRLLGGRWAENEDNLG